MRRRHEVWAILSVLTLIVMTAAGTETADRGIDIWDANPRYWQLDGEPVLLIGGSKEDNLFQIPDIEEHLDLLHSVGGNYVRNTMSSRDEGNVWAFKKVGDSYDLDQWNDEYWNRFDRFLRLTGERDVFVQIEVWATFDYYRQYWDRNPLNPKNNSTYTVEESGLPTEVKGHPLQLGNNFFWSIPAERNQKVVLKYQQRFVDKMLSYSLEHGHVLYCMDNETAVTPEWGIYWSGYIKGKAAEKGKTVQTTEMWDPWNLSHPKHNATFDHPETYSFVDISQNNHNKGDKHWNNIAHVSARIDSNRRPMNCVKMYGADGGPFGSSQDAVERFWRNVFGGIAAVRFHRPDAGLGLNKAVLASIKSMRMLAAEIDVFASLPHNDLLGEREANEAYCMAEPGKAYAVYLPNGGEVRLNTGASKGGATVRWLDIMASAWQPPENVPGGDAVLLTCPGEGHWAVLVVAE
ncbi:MAG: hypothetical protein GY851_29650 [bacterium]|nr:hypothetical protein [bacterium]